ncbi:MAG: hypothetical protein E3J23_03375 [Candidatus Stahlbacteria bacterium]|jgi:vacuolar-type H+-ATPase subunit E/Vma4|nr:hypothetical protein [candidate division WOR-3 bacterium]TEU00144.1 MAG: hypothetical protein E3J23_03375 [Candidatus Stahlbacteria bacterium]
MKKGIKELEKKILDKAYDEATQLVSKAKKAKGRIIKIAREEAREIEEEAQNKGKKLLGIEKKRISSEKMIDEKKEYLTIRQKIIECLKEDLEKKFIEMLKNNEFREWVKSKCKEIIHTEKEKMVLVTREGDKKIYEEIVKELENLSLIIEPIESGFLLRGEKTEYDFRFNILAENLICENKNMIVSILCEENG